MVQFMHLLRYSLFISILGVLLLFLTTANNTVSAQKQNQTVQFTRLGVPIAVVPGLTGNVLTVVSFLIGTSSFLVGLRIQNATRTATTPPSSLTGYFELLILALVIPALAAFTMGYLHLSSFHGINQKGPLPLCYTVYQPQPSVLLC